MVYSYELVVEDLSLKSQYCTDCVLRQVSDLCRFEFVERDQKRSMLY